MSDNPTSGVQLQPYSVAPDFCRTLDIAVSLVRRIDGFWLEHILRGPAVAALDLPPLARLPGRHDELWKASCVEAFFGVQGSSRYYEFNGSPAGHWALYRFEDYRHGMRAQPVSAPPVLSVRDQQGDSLRLLWQIPFFGDDHIDRAGITAVLHSFDAPGEPGYWALAHAGTQPDFHLGDSFVYPLPA